MKRFNYISYGGPEDFIFIRCHKNDYKKSLILANKLIEEKIRVFFDSADDSDEHLPEEVSGGILNAKLCVFYISKEALNDLDFRNSINFALSSKIKTVCIKENDFEMGHGMDMQLANVTIYKNIDELYNYIINNEEYKDCYGDGQIKNNNDSSKKIITLIVFALLVLLIIIGVLLIRNRINYYRSAEYRLSSIDKSEYLDFTSFTKDDFVYLEGKNIGLLYCADMNLENIEVLEKLNIKEIDISGNTNINVEPLCKNNNLTKVIISQDMIEFAEELYSSGKIVEIYR